MDMTTSRYSRSQLEGRECTLWTMSVRGTQLMDLYSGPFATDAFRQARNRAEDAIADPDSRVHSYQGVFHN